MIGRLIQQIHARRLRQQGSHGGTPLLTAGKSRQWPLGMPCDPEALQRLGGEFAVRRRFALPELQMRMAPGQYRLERCQSQRLFAILRQQTQVLGDRAALE